MEREPGWYWVRLMGSDWLPGDYCYEELRGHMMVADGSRFYDLSEVAEWGPRIPTPDEPALPPAKVRDEMKGWHWNPKLVGYVKTLDEENNEWVRAFVRHNSLVVERQAGDGDDNAEVSAPVEVIRALLGYAPAGGDERLREAIELVRRVRDEQPRHDVNRERLDKVMELLEGRTR